MDGLAAEAMDQAPQETESVEQEAPPAETENAPQPQGEGEGETTEGPGSEPLTKEQKIDMAHKILGVDKDKIVVDQNGGIKVIMKINGKNKLVSQNDIMKGYNLNQAGYEKLQEGKQVVKQFQEFLGGLKENPQNLWQLADRLGLNKHELAKSLLEEKVRELEMTPEEKRLKELEDREAEYRKKEEEQKQAMQQAQMQEETRKEMQRYDQELTTELTKQGFKGKDASTKSHIMIGAIGELMVATQAGQNMSVADAVYRAKQKWQDYVIGVLDDIDDDHIADIIPERILKAIRKSDLKKVDLSGIPTSRSQPDYGQQIAMEDADDSQPSRSGGGKVSMSDFFRNL